MEHVTLCLNTSLAYDISLTEQVRMLKDTGFNGFFTPWNPDKFTLGEMRSLADSIGMLYQSVHGPTKGVADIWEPGAIGDAALRQLLLCAEDCGRNGVPIMVSHTYRTFVYREPSREGLDRYRRLADACGENGVMLALENTEGKYQLRALMDAMGNHEAVGFCWDCGHEMCYDHGEDVLGQYGEHLLCTHLNDNLGVRDFDGVIGALDDLHLLPFDGIGDWENIVHRLNDWHYDGPLTFELKKVNHPSRHETDGYVLMTMERFFAEAYMRACRVAALKKRDRLSRV